MSSAHHHHHDHGTENVSDKALLWAVGLNVGLSVFEVAAGAIAGSVALYADALHNFNDCAALLIAYLARRIARQAACSRYTFGRRRAELIGALINLTALLVVGVYLVGESISRFMQPTPVDGMWVMAASVVALVIDLGTVWLLWSLSKGGLNLRAAFVHNLSDALSSVAVLAGGAAVWAWGWTWVDPGISLMIAGYIIWLSIGMMRETCHILMEGAPPALDTTALQNAVEALDGVSNLHHLHVWQLDEHHIALEAHVVTTFAHMDQQTPLREAIKRLLHDRFEIEHATLEFETGATACPSNELFPPH